MEIEEIATGTAGTFLLYRVTDSQANESVYIILTQGELIFLKEIEADYKLAFFGKVKPIGS
jgi:hypothetical protein